MKNLDTEDIFQDKIQIEQVQEEDKKIYQGTVKLKKGQRLWSISMTENFATVKPVDITPEKSKTVTLDKGHAVSKSTEIIINPQHFYCAALNERNAIKKYIQYLIATKKIIGVKAR